jgi:hypothetical protein
MESIQVDLTRLAMQETKADQSIKDSLISLFSEAIVNKYMHDKKVSEKDLEEAGIRSLTEHIEYCEDIKEDIKGYSSVIKKLTLELKREYNKISGQKYLELPLFGEDNHPVLSKIKVVVNTYWNIENGNKWQYDIKLSHKNHDGDRLSKPECVLAMVLNGTTFQSQWRSRAFKENEFSFCSGLDEIMEKYENKIDGFVETLNKHSLQYGCDFVELIQKECSVCQDRNFIHEQVEIPKEMGLNVLPEYKTIPCPECNPTGLNKKSLNV